MTEKSTFFIKPDGAEFEKLILGRVTKSGLVIVRQGRIILTEPILRHLYHRLTSDLKHQALWEKTFDVLFQQEVTAGIVSGTDALHRLVHLCGTSTKPSDCESHTIRYQFAGRAVWCTPYLYGADATP